MIKKTEKEGLRSRKRIIPPKRDFKNKVETRSDERGKTSSINRKINEVRTPPMIGRGREEKTITRKNDAVRFVPLGGLDAIGRNMMFFEYQDEIVIIDAGFQFPEEDTPGIDFILPNVEYLEKNKDKIKAMIITHAHLDHIGAIPYIMEKIGNPVIYTTALSKEIINKRQEEVSNTPKLKYNIIESGQNARLSSNFSVHFFAGAHTIPDAVAVLLKTPVGNICNLGDFRVEYDLKGNPLGIDELEAVGKMGVHSLLMDSTGAEKSGTNVSEELVEQNIEMLLREAKGRVIIGTFASLLDRLEQIMRIAGRLGKKVAISGRSMKNNIQIVQNLGYLKTPKGLIVPLEELGKYNDNKVVVLSTGAQGESNASLMKIILGEHKFIRIKPGDTILFSSSIIPGNERSVQGLKDNLARQGAIIYDASMIDIHSSGHGSREDIKLAVKSINPKFFVPVHGYYFMRYTNINNAIATGIKKDNCIMMDNGEVAELTKTQIKILDETVPSSYVMVDGLGVGDVGEVVLRDRRMLSQEGMVVIITTLDKKTGRIIKNPDIISRGFIYLKNNREVLDEIRKRVRGLIGRLPADQKVDADYFKGLVRDQVGQYIFKKTKRRPMLLPVVIEV